MKENKQQTILSSYLRESKMYGFFELKVTASDHLPFSKIEPHQYQGLQATSKNGLVWKLSDVDQRQKPCDCLAIPPLQSYLVIGFKDGFYIIDIWDIVKMRDEGSIAITRNMAEKLAVKIIKIKSQHDEREEKFARTLR